jgi:hypothetical protein
MQVGVGLVGVFYHSGVGLFSRSRMSTALTMMNLFTPAAAVASKTLTAPVSQVNILDMITSADFHLP